MPIQRRPAPSLASENTPSLCRPRTSPSPWRRRGSNDHDTAAVGAQPQAVHRPSCRHGVNESGVAVRGAAENREARRASNPSQAPAVGGDPARRRRGPRRRPGRSPLASPSALSMTDRRLLPETVEAARLRCRARGCPRGLRTWPGGSSTRARGALSIDAEGAVDQRAMPPPSVPNQTAPCSSATSVCTLSLGRPSRLVDQRTPAVRERQATPRSASQTTWTRRPRSATARNFGPMAGTGSNRPVDVADTPRVRSRPTACPGGRRAWRGRAEAAGPGLRRTSRSGRRRTWRGRRWCRSRCRRRGLRRARRRRCRPGRCARA